MDVEGWPHPRERQARRYRRARLRWNAPGADRFPMDQDGRGFRGDYADRPEYALPRGVLEPPAPAGSGWPSPVFELSDEARERHRRALRDRELARIVDLALYTVIGEEADGIAVYACDSTIRLAGRVSHEDAAIDALRTAEQVRGVRRVVDHLEVDCW